MKILIVKVKGPEKDAVNPQNRLLQNIRTTFNNDQPPAEEPSGYQVELHYKSVIPVNISVTYFSNINCVIILQQRIELKKKIPWFKLIKILFFLRY